jgi:anti-anti-sigma factor
MTEELSFEIDSATGFATITFLAATLSKSEQIAVLSSEICEFIQSKKPCAVIVDFGEVKFFSSEVLGVLINVRKKLSALGSKVVISGLNPKLYRVFRITNLDSIFNFYDDKVLAIEALSSAT